MVYNLYTLRRLQDNSSQAEINGRWVPARPIRFFSWINDIKLAWLVFTKRADAFTWPEGQ